MDRENFYILLELPIDPPETDLEAIEAAITKKQAEWSRLRNHPTKGLQAQQFIGMIPEIRRVMSDPGLREEEAAAAKTHAETDKAGKIGEIDRHIDILMGKGFISKEETIRLATLHSMTEKDIQDRIRLKKNEKFSLVDQQLSLRMTKGYITEDEINKLAKRHSIKPEDVKSRVYTPMVMGDKAKSPSPPRQLDKSIEKAIRENLKLVDKASLYDFLGLHESADLESLQQAALEKKKQLSRVGRKDAAVTAGNTLAGHCATIFKNEESRVAYDISLAKSRLADLDSDIDISGFNGKIRQEYFKILVEKAMDFGMEEDEAKRYIKEYCARKNWTIEPPPDKKKGAIIRGAIVGVALIAAVTIGALYVNYSQKQNILNEYENFLVRVRAETDLQGEINLLRQYILEHQGDKHYTDLVEDAGERKENRRLALAEKRYAEMSARFESAIGEGDFQTAKSHVDDYLATDPPAQYQRKAKDELDAIDARMEKQAFEELNTIIVEADTKEKIRAVTGYMENHPQGRHIDEVKKMLNDMSNEYYLYVKSELERAEERQDWQAGADLAQSYIDLYDNSNADNLERALDRYKNNIRQERVFASLQQTAQRFGEDYQQALRVYTDHLEAYPNTPIKERVKAEIDRLSALQREAGEKKAREEMLDKIRAGGANERFVEKTEGVVKDSETGLMWTLLDTATCMTFDQAEHYVDQLSTGDYSDWRLPTMDEIAGIYKKTPSFPVTEAQRYWSEESYSGYSDGWYKVVNILEVTSGGTARESNMDSRECGAVRAVRD